MSESKICLVQNPCGLGDLIFTRKIGLHYASLGYRVIWPVIHEYAWLNDYFDGIEYISWQDNDRKLTHLDKLPDHLQFPYKERLIPMAPSEFGDKFIYLNLFLPPNGPVMANKYREAKLDFSDWADYVLFKRNPEKEKALLNRLNIKDGEKFVFVNKYYQMRPNVLQCNINTDPNYYNCRVVQLEILPEFTLIDWLAVVERASCIHMIETSLCYLLESKQMRDKITKDLHLYSRYNNFSEVSYLFNIPWNYH